MRERRREKKDYVRMSTGRIIVQKKSDAFYERYSQINYSSHASKITSTSMKLPLEFHRTNGIPERWPIAPKKYIATSKSGSFRFILNFATLNLFRFQNYFNLFIWNKLQLNC